MAVESDTIIKILGIWDNYHFDQLNTIIVYLDIQRQ